MMPRENSQEPLGLFIQPACLQHKYIRHPNSSHIFERPERLRAVLLGVAAGVARMEEAAKFLENSGTGTNHNIGETAGSGEGDDLSSLLASLSIGITTQPTTHLHLVTPPMPPSAPGNILLHHPAVQLAHSPPPEAPFPYIGPGSTGGAGVSFPSSEYLKDLAKWASGAVEMIKSTGCEIPEGLGLNPGDLYLGPGSVIAIEGAIQTVCQAVDSVIQKPPAVFAKEEPSTPPVSGSPTISVPAPFTKAFCAIRPPGHHCGEDEPSGFCYVNNVVVGAMHAYLQHDIDRAIIIDFDLHHGNGTQALVMPLNAAAYADDIQVKAGKPATIGKNGRRRRGWKGFYGSVHDIYSYPCEDGDLDLIRDASVSLAAHGQYIENIHLKPYSSEADFYERIYPLYLDLLDKAKVYMEQTEATPGRTVVFISAGFDACEHEHQGMQRHDRRVPVSFYSRYTKDIAAFADKYTEGKIVSVLEGGYGDRALTSAAMGHIVGMKGSLPEGCDTWWTEAELINLEKATKKKRGGKLAPIHPDLVSQPHLIRTHALLAHFEGTVADSAPPSVQTTPAARMTLRDRKKQEDSGRICLEGTPAVVRRVGRGRGGGGGTAASTPTHGSKLRAEAEMPLAGQTPTGKSATTKTTPTKFSAKEPLIATPEGHLSSEKAESEDGKTKVEQDWMDEAVKGLANVSLGGSEVAAITNDYSQPYQQPPQISEPAEKDQSIPTTMPKIMLRIPARTPANGSPSAERESEPYLESVPVPPAAPTPLHPSHSGWSQPSGHTEPLEKKADGHREDLIGMVAKSEQVERPTVGGS